MGTRYEIRVRGRISPGWAAWLGGMEVAPLPDGATLLRGELSDQPALFGVLARVRDLGLTLISVRQLGTDEPEGALSCAQE
jgi:hypothetical protein